MGVGRLSFLSIVADFLSGGKKMVSCHLNLILPYQLRCWKRGFMVVDVVKTLKLLPSPKILVPVPFTFLHSSGFPEVHS